MRYTIFLHKSRLLEYEESMRSLLAWTFYSLGDLVSRWNDHDKRFTAVGFNLYQWLMRVSDDIQGETDKGPWRPAPASGEGD